MEGSNNKTWQTVLDDCLFLEEIPWSKQADRGSTAEDRSLLPDAARPSPSPSQTGVPHLANPVPCFGESSPKHAYSQALRHATAQLRRGVTAECSFEMLFSPRRGWTNRHKHGCPLRFSPSLRRTLVRPGLGGGSAVSRGLRSNKVHVTAYA